MTENSIFQSVLQWWDALPGILKVFWMLAVPSTLLFLIQMILVMFGFDSDHDLDAPTGDGGLGVHADSGMNLFSVRNLIIFMTVFSWSGITGISSKFDTGATLVVSFMLALGIMVLVAWMFKKMSSMGENGNFDITKAKGSIATVYIPIIGSSKGKVSAKVDGRLVELEAVSLTKKDIPTGTVVEIVEVADKQFVVVKIK
ncbi:MAG TPA: hypothetical protein PKG52_08770 [bacterium]|nr:hypothetical protein [bacterium]HPS29877.1 hypothetical protein [bacterium]